MIARALPGDQFVPVGTLGGGNGEVLDINAAGVFVGWWYDNTFNQRAFVYTEAGGVRDLSELAGFAGSGGANAINDRGSVVGVIRNSIFQQRAFMWRDGVMTDLGTLGGDASAAQDVNAHGVTVGWARAPDGLARAFRVDDKGAMQDIQALAGAMSGPRDINAHGRIVGVGTTNMYSRWRGSGRPNPASAPSTTCLRGGRHRHPRRRRHQPRWPDRSQRHAAGNVQPASGPP